MHCNAFNFALTLLLWQAPFIFCNQESKEIFAPDVQATCKRGFMVINVVFKSLPYKGVIHSRGFRQHPCAVMGDGSNSVTLKLPLITDTNSPEFCGVRTNSTTKEKFLPLVVRAHNFLELKEDKYYTIKCGLQGFRNANNESSFVDLQLLDMDHRKTNEAIFNRQYILQALIAGPDADHSMRIQNCFTFGDPNVSVALTDDYGCPYDQLSSFTYNDTAGTAEATLSMFRFPESNRVHFQCEVLICKKPCEYTSCGGVVLPERLTQSTKGASASGNQIDRKETVKAATSVFVVDPTNTALRECSWYPPWLWILAIALAVLFIIMMIINIFLCSAMTCSCTKTSVIEKEPSILEDYDPYRSSWHGSQCGSRYSLNGKHNGGYLSGASTLNSARSISSHSDHYAAIVHNRPDSQYSRPDSRHHHGNGHHHHNHGGHHSERGHHSHSSGHHRSPPSTTGSHYSHHRM